MHGFTLDPGIGEFLLSHHEIRIPDHGPYYGANEGTIRRLGRGARAASSSGLHESDAATGRPYSTRYSGALVSDFHRIVLKGGIYLYPATGEEPEGARSASCTRRPPSRSSPRPPGGAASDGRRRILDIRPSANHERTPIYLGSKGDVARVDAYVAVRGVAVNFRKTEREDSLRRRKTESIKKRSDRTCVFRDCSWLSP